MIEGWYSYCRSDGEEGDVIMDAKTKACIIAFVATAALPTATAQEARATVSEVSGDDATVIVVRQSDTFALLAGDELFDGDRVIVRPRSEVQIAALDCTISLNASESLMVSSDICNTEIAMLAPGGAVGAAQPVGAAAPLWTLFSATSAPMLATAEALNNGGGPVEADPIVAENTSEAASP